MIEEQTEVSIDHGFLKRGPVQKTGGEVNQERDKLQHEIQLGHHGSSAGNWEPGMVVFTTSWVKGLKVGTHLSS